jgi:hypothetical protein
MSVVPPNGQQRDAIADAGRVVVTGAGRAARSVADGVTAASQEATRTAAATAKAAWGAFWTWLSRITPGMVLAWLLRLLCLPVLGLTYTVISAEGLRGLLTVLATPLHKALPVLSFLGAFRETRRLDVAVVLSLVLMAGSWVAWGKVIRIYLTPPDRLSNEEKLIWTVGGSLLVCDAILFFLGVIAGGGFLVGFGVSIFAAVILTVLYVALLVLASYVICWLES